MIKNCRGAIETSRYPFSSFYNGSRSQDSDLNIIIGVTGLVEDHRNECTAIHTRVFGFVCELGACVLIGFWAMSTEFHQRTIFH